MHFGGECGLSVQYVHLTEVNHELLGDEQFLVVLGDL